MAAEQGNRKEKGRSIAKESKAPMCEHCCLPVSAQRHARILSGSSLIPSYQPIYAPRISTSPSVSRASLCALAPLHLFDQQLACALEAVCSRELLWLARPSIRDKRRPEQIAHTGVASTWCKLAGCDALQVPHLGLQALQALLLLPITNTLWPHKGQALLADGKRGFLGRFTIELGAWAGHQADTPDQDPGGSPRRGDGMLEACCCGARGVECQSSQAERPSAEQRPCAHPGCSKHPSFAEDGDPRRWCSEHKPEGAKDVKNKPCAHPGCSKSPSFAEDGDPRRWCRAHKPDGAMPIQPCAHEGCTKSPSFAEDGDPRRWCDKHKPDGALPIRPCAHPGCSKSPSFAEDGDPRRWCRAHKPDGAMPIQPCAHEGCTKSPSFAEDGDPRRWCRAHKPDGAMPIRPCAREGCTKRPSFAEDGDPRRWCAKHKPDGALPIRPCAREGCTKSPSFAEDGDPRRWCRAHNPEGAKDVKHKSKVEAEDFPRVGGDLRLSERPSAQHVPQHPSPCSTRPIARPPALQNKFRIVVQPPEISDRNIPANISNTEALTWTLSEISKAEGRVAKSTNVILGELGGQGENSQEKWRQLDEKVNTYPMQREFKAIGTGGDDFAQAVVAAISEVVGPIKDSAVSQRLSSQQKYTSVTVGPVWIDNTHVRMTVLEESVYNLIPPAQQVPPKPALYHSKHHGVVDPKQYEMGVKTIRKAATFGVPNGCNATSPDRFLQSHAKEPILPEPSKPTMTKMRIKDSVPKRSERPVMGLMSNKNFITCNAVETILAEPKGRKSQEFLYTQKPDFGKVPDYLQKNKSRIESEKAQVEAYLKLRQQQEQDAHVSQVSEEERQQLLRHLKTKWATVNAAYQKLPFSLDTPAKQKRKENYERQLTDIEKDIRLLERGDTILVLQD
ncbi:hypothetical protein WJX72_008869 [[Myrmecia] bisecta]|uniref:Enkurin domain-containing protein n=1 Tax=[Myrmecia] bisecta TaxID=41462 RepID=A0AAW1R8S6_9CHLO